MVSHGGEAAQPSSSAHRGASFLPSSPSGDDEVRFLARTAQATVAGMPIRGPFEQDPIPLPWEGAKRTTQQLSITSPNEMADAVKPKVHSGEYASESEVVRDGLRALLARDRAVDNCLQEQVGSAYDALKADPSRRLTAAQV